MNPEHLIIHLTVDGTTVKTFKYESWHDEIFLLNAQQKQTLLATKNLQIPMSWADFVAYTNYREQLLEKRNSEREQEREQLLERNSELTRENLDRLKDFTEIKNKTIKVEKGINELFKIATDEKMDIEERKSRTSQIKMEIEKDVNFYFFMKNYY